MNNPLMPEQRPDSNGKVVTRWVKSAVHGSSQKFSAPPPTAAPSGEKTERSRGLFEKVLDSLVNLLLGPEQPESKADAEAREVLRERLSELPERTVRNLGEAWEKAKAWADKGLDSTEFGMFSTRVREQVANMLAEQERKEQTPAQAAEVIDDYADRMRRSTEARMTPPRPQHEPSVHHWQNEPSRDVEPEYSPLNDFFQDVERGPAEGPYYNSSINDMMDNGRTRRHH